MVKEKANFILRGIGSCVVHNTDGSFSASSRSGDTSAKVTCLLLGIILCEWCRQVRVNSE